MCGITGIFCRRDVNVSHLVQSNSIVSHRGPDDEGYLVYREPSTIEIFAGDDTAPATRAHFQYRHIAECSPGWKVALGHRRLSIIDLSPHGHQPMVLPQAQLAITFNGEIFNYIEVREELRSLNHEFNTHSDTEVILHAWAQWGEQALHKFNGMFAFLLLDGKRRKLYAVRDRFGVKPLYWTDTSSYIAFSSEAKQLRVLPSYDFRLHKGVAYDFLRYSLLDHTDQTLEQNVWQVKPGHFIEVDLTENKTQVKKWYALRAARWRGTGAEAIDTFRELLRSSVQLRLRSDVPVGSALSGGLDSSTLVCLMHSLLKGADAAHPIQTVTSCYTDKKYDEWEYADEIVRTVGARPHRVFPDFDKLARDLERLLWHMDYPFGSTSMFAQWCVFEGAHKAGLKVMIDGQGADEQLAGYAGNEAALYAGLIRRGKLFSLVDEIRAYKGYRGEWPAGFIISAIQQLLPAPVVRALPARYQVYKEAAPPWLARRERSRVPWPVNLSQNLQQQVQVSPLPSLLRYEDRNSMAFSVESRVPFMDYRLIEFTLGLPENLILRRGERKFILRQAFKGVVPDKVLQRRDKMGFVSPEERWLKGEGKDWFAHMIEAAGNIPRSIFAASEARELLKKMQNDVVPFSFDIWRISILSAWLKQRA